MGCYAYLERLGVRWYFPEKQYEIVPRRSLDWNMPLDDSESPAFSIHPRKPQSPIATRSEPLYITK